MTKTGKNLTPFLESVKKVNWRLIKTAFLARTISRSVVHNSGVAWARAIPYFFCRFLVTLLVTVAVDCTGALFLDALF